MFGTDPYIAAYGLKLVDPASADEISRPYKILCIDPALGIIRILFTDCGKRLELV